MAKDLATFVKDKAQKYTDRVFLKDFGSDREISYKQLEEITNRLAWGFRAIGLKKNDRVALLHPNHSDVILAYIAIAKAGGATVPINTLYSPAEIEYIINDAGASFLVTTADHHDQLAQIIPNLTEMKQVLVKRGAQTIEDVFEGHIGPLKTVKQEHSDPEAPAIIFYTSGTTGKPKGVKITHKNLTFSGPNVAQSYGLRENDVTIAALPLVHVFANASPVFGSLSSGGTVVVMERFKSEDVFAAVVRHGVTWYPGVPTMFHYLLSAHSKDQYDLRSLRMMLSGGASLSVEALTKLEKQFNIDVLEVYGLTESTGLVTANPVYGVRKQGSIGIAVSGVEVKVVDTEGRHLAPGEVGELVFRGPNVCQGYWHLPQLTEKKIFNGWMHTGDHAYKDEDGYYFIVGRENDLIITMGYNIYPREIEEIFYKHPDVLEVAVIGLPHPEKGEIPKAYVAVRSGTSVNEADLQEFCRTQLAGYKVPEISFLEDLPKNHTGKIMKNMLPKT
ncbi:class I adenylate-forming enzyme family protein [Desulfatitalea alkaliphila]|uniref:AMP-binding protein n=1 Tax=Desulfatitalea alkaliphila TaxID=2929485 RepID=A0AA41UJQ0_9BACT|nr:AMP-binding protein [Desulfatitalea alkaliphila]MCJ8500697.1 AMP-binding protein [Desulfatitalea alkaliphila]